MMSKKKFPVKSEEKCDEESTHNQVEFKRRKAVGRIMASTGIVATMSGSWKKPVLTSAILPAHAESTCPDGDSGGDCPDGVPSDIRMKTNIQNLDATALGLQLYRFEYRRDPGRKTYVGVMAQHLEDSHPEALTEGSDGLLRVNYGSLGLKMATLEEWNELGIAVVKLH